MAFKAIDFAALAAERESSIKTVIEGRLARPSEIRFDLSGEATLSIAIVEDGRSKKSRAVWHEATHEEMNAFQLHQAVAAFEALDHQTEQPNGPRVRMHGYWARRSWKNPAGHWTSVFEFKTARIEVLD